MACRALMICHPDRGLSSERRDLQFVRNLAVPAPSIIVPDSIPNIEAQVGLSRPEGMDLRAGQGGRVKAHQGRSRSRTGDRRNHRPRLQMGAARQTWPGRSGAAVRKRQRLSRREGLDQPVRLRASHAHGSGCRLPGRNCRAHQVLHGRQVAAGHSGQNQDAAHAGRDGQVLSQGSFHRSLQGSHQARQFLAARFSHPAMLASGWRPLHYFAVGHHQRSENRQAEFRNLSASGL